MLIWRSLIRSLVYVSVHFLSLSLFWLMPLFYYIFFNIFFLFYIDTSVVPPLIYAFMGSSREIAIGPVAVVSLLLSSMLQEIQDPVADPVAYRRLVFTVTLFAGIFQASFGLLRFGFSLFGSIFLANIFISFVMLWFFFSLQIGFSCGLFVSCCHCWVHGWSCHSHWSSTNERLACNQQFHYQNWCGFCFGICCQICSSDSKFSVSNHEIRKTKSFKVLNFFFSCCSGTLWTLYLAAPS